MIRFLSSFASFILILSACSNLMQSPDGNIKVDVNDNNLTVTYCDSTVFANVHLGLKTDQTDLDSALTLVSVSKPQLVVDDYKMVAGKRSHCINEAKERVFSYKNPNGEKLDVILRVYDDGIAIRYVLPEGTMVVDDMTSFDIKEGVNRWISPHNNDSDYEQFFPHATDGNSASSPRMWGPRPPKGHWAFPALAEPSEGIFALITEADLRRGDSGASLDNSSDNQIYKVRLTGNTKFNQGLSPWRIAIIGKLDTIVESTLVTDLSTPSQIEDTDWIKPGVSSWIYWAYNHSSKDWPTVKEYIDLAVEMKWPYSLIDWEWPEMVGGGDINTAMEYAHEKGVKINLWYNSGTSWIGPGAPQPQDRLNTAENREKEMTWLESIGATGIKVDFFNPDDATMVDYYLDLLEDAARHHLLVDFHGCTIPRGWQRTWPNMMSMESVYGAEWYNNAPVLTTKAAAHNATLPFTRNVVGPMDYTPGTFSDSQHPHITTNAHELALTVLFESGLQHMPDRPSAYAGLPQEIKDFFAELPSAWDDTKLLAGYPGESVVIAREKAGKWYIAGINGLDEAQDLSFELTKIALQNPEGQLFCDGEEDRVIDVKPLKPEGTLIVPCRPRGGFLAILE